MHLLLTMLEQERDVPPCFCGFRGKIDSLSVSFIASSSVSCLAFPQVVFFRSRPGLCPRPVIGKQNPILGSGISSPMLESLLKDDDRAFAKLQGGIIGDRAQEGVLHFRNLQQQFHLSRAISLWSRMVMSVGPSCRSGPTILSTTTATFLETMTRQQQAMELNRGVSGSSGRYTCIVTYVLKFNNRRPLDWSR
jgi:hypothetical protein